MDSNANNTVGDNYSELSFGVQALNLIEEKGSPLATTLQARQKNTSFSSTSSAVGLPLSDASENGSVNTGNGTGNRNPGSFRFVLLFFQCFR